MRLPAHTATDFKQNMTKLFTRVFETKKQKRDQREKFKFQKIVITFRAFWEIFGRVWLCLKTNFVLFNSIKDSLCV